MCARVIWFRKLVGEYSLVSVLKGVIYPVFFVGNHVPLYIFLQNTTINLTYFNIFLALQFVHLLLWVFHGYRARVQQKLNGVIKEYYYLSRGIAVASYIILLFGFLA